MYSVSLVCAAMGAAVAEKVVASPINHVVLSPSDDDGCSAHVEDGAASCSVALLQMNARKTSKKVHVFPSEAKDPEGDDTASAFDWTYDEPQQWASDFPDCAGQSQSPIDISPDPDNVPTSDPGTSSMSDKASYVPVPPTFALETVNNGHSLQVNGDFGELLLPDGIYEAKQFHFHFPSEHSLFGELADGEMHIVHQRKGATGTDGIAVVAILLKKAADVGFSPSFLRQRSFFRKIGLSAGVRPGSPFPITETLDIADVFAEELGGGFYHYQGSLTTPPCSETVHWYVLKTEAAVSQRQIDTFEALFPGPANNRPAQPLNQRLIVEDQIVVDPAEFPDLATAESGGSDHPKDATHWGYDNTDVWGKVYPDCVGSYQSPIDISSFLQSPVVQLSTLASYDNVNGPLKIFNNGHSIQVNGNFGTLQLPNGEYEVKQFHFHFPSEHEVDGKYAAGEMHIVHQLKGATGTDNLAVISILLQDLVQLQ